MLVAYLTTNGILDLVVLYLLFIRPHHLLLIRVRVIILLLFVQVKKRNKKGMQENKKSNMPSLYGLINI